MKLKRIIWLSKVVDKLEYKHKVRMDEVEQVFESRPQYRRLELGKIDGEHVYAAYGQTDAGRYLTVIFIRKFGEHALIVSARDMDRKERRQYDK